MSGKRLLKTRTIGYQPAFTREEVDLLKGHDIDSLTDEIWINRVMLLRATNKMNEVKDQLTFRDHLDALHAVSYATGRIASLLQIHEELSRPYKEVEKQYRQYFEEVSALVGEIGPLVFGEEKWDEMLWEAFEQRMNPDNTENHEISLAVKKELQ